MSLEWTAESGQMRAQDPTPIDPTPIRTTARNLAMPPLPPGAHAHNGNHNIAIPSMGA